MGPSSRGSEVPRRRWSNPPVALSSIHAHSSASTQGTTLAAPASWNYVTLGDSLATGFGAFKGYVSRYEAYIETDTGVAVTRTNLGQNKWTSSQPLSALRNDSTFRHATRET